MQEEQLEGMAECLEETLGTTGVGIAIVTGIAVGGVIALSGVVKKWWDKSENVLETAAEATNAEAGDNVIKEADKA